MKYLSLFSGIGGFEVAIHRVFPDSECIGYSEIKPHAVKVYEQHFPGHKNLGDIREIKEEKIREVVKDGCDIIFGGFPCKNLSSLASIKGGNLGLDGNKSGLFYEMMKIIKYVNKILNKKVHVLFENNASMSNKNKTIITNIIKDEYKNINMTVLNGSEFGVQCRKRLFWTDFVINKSDIICSQIWDDILDPVDKNMNISDNYLKCLNKSIHTKKLNKKILSVGKIQRNTGEYKFFVNTINDTYKSRWQMSFHSDTCDDNSDIPYTYPIGKCRPITASFGNHNVLIDRRNRTICQKDTFSVRMFSYTEMEKLFGYSEGYTLCLSHSKSKRRDVIGNSVIVPVIEYIFTQLKVNTNQPST
jgi:DNA-cytosine methyltransferase